MSGPLLPLYDDDLASEALPLDGRRRMIQPADVRGRFHAWRRAGFVALVTLWIALPWIPVGGHPAVFIDVTRRCLYLFGLTFNAQDTWLLFFLLTGVAFSLLFATTLFGRAWCGWACPQTVFLEGVYRRIERWIEGPRDRRLRRNAGPLTLEKVLRKGASQVAFVVLSFLIAHVFLAYFVSLPETFAMVRHSPGEHPEAFAWAAALTVGLYLDFAWFREQFCVVLCPYGRLQSVLTDRQSLVVGYDARRGEPRGKKGTSGAGDCVDCKRCVAVCPTGIDIRRGTQMECVACTACIDACDEVMERLGRPRGLIRYDAQDGLEGRPWKILRPRVIFYGVLMVVGAVVAFVSTRGRTDFEANLLRLPGEPYTVEDGTVRDALQLHLVNKVAAAETYRIEVEPAPGMQVVLPMASVPLASLADTRVPIFLAMPRAQFHGDFPVRVTIRRDGDASEVVRVVGTFLGPS